jgi:hypothetical protein
VYGFVWAFVRVSCFGYDMVRMITTVELGSCYENLGLAWPWLVRATTLDGCDLN